MELLSPVLVLLARALATSIHLRWRERGGAVNIVLNMAPNSFDDQYLRCHFRMMRALPALNHTKFVPRGDFAEAWSKAVALWDSRPYLGVLLQLEQATALLAYTMEEGLYPNFNRATLMAGRSRQEYLHSFRFKVLHFLLTEALKDLQSTWSQPYCLHVYWGVTVCFVTSLEWIVCFGQFASTSLLKNISMSYGTSTVFEVDTCYGADIRHFSDYPEEEEVLIPPFATFKVTNVTHQGNKTYIHLHSHGVPSNYNCAWFRGRGIPREPPGLTGLLLAVLAAVTGTP